MAERKLIAHLSGRGVGLLPERDHDAAGEIAVRFEAAIDVELLRRAVHGVDRGQPDGAEAAERFLEPLVAGVGVGLRDDLLHQPHRGPLLQLAGRHAVLAGDGRFFGEGDRSGDTRQIERGTVGQRGVAIEEFEQHGSIAGRFGEEIATNPGLRERFVVETPALNPAIGVHSFAFPRDAGSDVIETSGGEEIGALSADRAHQGVNVGIGETGHKGYAAAINERRAGAAHGADGVVVAGGQDVTVFECDCAARGEGGIQRTDAGSPDDRIGMGGHACSSWRAPLRPATDQKPDRDAVSGTARQGTESNHPQSYIAP